MHANTNLHVLIKKGKLGYTELSRTCVPRGKFMWGHSKLWPSARPEERAQENPTHWHLTLDLPPPEPWGVRLCSVNHSVCAPLLWKPEQTNAYDNCIFKELPKCFPKWLCHYTAINSERVSVSPSSPWAMLRQWYLIVILDFIYVNIRAAHVCINKCLLFKNFTYSLAVLGLHWYLSFPLDAAGGSCSWGWETRAL